MASRSLGSFFPDALQDELNQVKEPDDKYYHIEFQKDSRREINPFKLRDFLSAKCGQQIDKLTVDSKDGFSFQVKSIRPQNALFEIDQFNDITCKISLHNYLNECKGLMYIQNFEFNDDFKEALKKEYPYIKDANAADFIKTKNEATTAVLLTFNLPQPPYSIYIPGEPKNTVVYKFIDRPMMCRKCHKYGHTTKRCNKEETSCKNCGGTDHEFKDCENVSKCSNCGGNHRAGSKECEVDKREVAIKHIQAESKVGRRRAIQMLAGEDESPRNNAISYPTHFRCKMITDENKKYNPWAIEKSFTNEIGKKPISIRSSAQPSEYIIEIAKESESKILPTIKSLALPEYQKTVQVEITPCNSINQCKGLIYIQDHNVSDNNTADNFCSRLQKEYNLHEVQKAIWIKTKNPNSTPLLLTFRENEPPRFLNIPGESAKTKVYEYFERPMNCKKCLEYSHTVKNCRKQTPTCAKCSVEGHKTEACLSLELKCLHCGGEHQAVSRNCPVFKTEEEIIKMQTKQRISKAEARRKITKQNPIKMNFASAIASSSKSREAPTHSHELSSDDSDATSETSVRVRKQSQRIYEEESATEPAPTHGYFTAPKRKSPPSPPTKVNGRRIQNKRRKN